ncbi:unnamed protein product, partial [marine sediment metagenome]
MYGQFKTLEQQKDSATLGMWVFLITEVMFFGGIMLAYTINRHTYFHAFAMGSNTLSLGLGGFNTVVLLASSFTMAMSVWSAQTGKKQWITMFLSLTILLGFVFFGVKYVEYAQKFHHHLVPGKSFDIFYCVNNPAKCEDVKEDDKKNESRNPCQPFRIHPPRNFRPPEVQPAQITHHRTAHHDVVKVSDDKVGVVDMDIRTQGTK